MIFAVSWKFEMPKREVLCSLILHRNSALTHLPWEVSSSILSSLFCFLGFNPWANLPFHPPRFCDNYVSPSCYQNQGRLDHRKLKPSKAEEHAGVRGGSHVCAHMWDVSIRHGDCRGRGPSRSLVSFWDSACTSSLASWPFIHPNGSIESQLIILIRSDTLSKTAQQRRGLSTWPLTNWHSASSNRGGILTPLGRWRTQEHSEVDRKKTGSVVALWGGEVPLVSTGYQFPRSERAQMKNERVFSPLWFNLSVLFSFYDKRHWWKCYKTDSPYFILAWQTNGLCIWNWKCW